MFIEFFLIITFIMLYIVLPIFCGCIIVIEIKEREYFLVFMASLPLFVLVIGTLAVLEKMGVI